MTFRNRSAPSSAFEAAPGDVLAPVSVATRLVLAGLVSVVAVTVLPVPAVVAWVAAYLIASIVERTALRRGGITPLLFAVSFALAALSAGMGWWLIQHGDGAQRFFAVALISLSSLNLLLRFYSAPRLFLFAISPLAGVVALTCLGIEARYLQRHQWLHAATPVAVFAIHALMIIPMRRKLAGAWARLTAAKVAAEAASQAKSDFLATMSHEIRTPLNGVLGMAQVMQADELSPVQAERLRLVRRSGETLLSILNDVLDLSKIEEGQLSLESEPFDLEHCTRGAVATFTALAETKNLTFDFAIDADARGSYLGDTVRLRQVIYNLVSNAVKFTETGGVSVRVSWRDGGLSIAVQDTGAGIAPDQVERLFEKFTQGDGSTTRRHGGTGLGLSICRQLAELMGGRIEVRSAPGQGSTFTLTAPIPRVSASETSALPADDAEGRPIRVLVAEDNPVNQMVLRTLLAQAGVEPTVVENGAEAVDAWRAGAWDVILMDIQMPVMDGVEATRTIRAGETKGERARTPIIAVTANAMAHQVKDYLAAGMDLVAPKPIDATRLFEAMEQVLSEAEGAETRAA